MTIDQEWIDRENILIAGTIEDIARTIKNVDIQVHLYELLAIVKDQDKEKDKATAIRTIVANLKDIQATYRNNASVLALAFNIPEETT